MVDKMRSVKQSLDCHLGQRAKQLSLRLALIETALTVSKYIAIYCKANQMSNLYSNNLAYHNPHHQAGTPIANSQKMREVYISPFKQTKQDQQRSTTQYSNSPCKFIKIDNSPLDSLPPKAVPFRRSSRNTSKERLQQKCEKSGQLKSFRNLNQSLQKRDRNVRIASLEKKLHQERADAEKWKNLAQCHQEKMRNLAQELLKSREERQALHGEMLCLRQQLQESQRIVTRQAEQIDSLHKSLKQSKINQKSLANLKQLQNQIDSLQQKNTLLVKQNQQLLQNNKKIKGQFFKKKQFTSQSQVDITKKEEKMLSLQMQVKRLKQQLSKDRSQRQMLLQSNLHALQKKLYDKQNQIKRISIQMNCLDRRKYISIDEVKAKKDQEIKGLRQKLDKVNKDLKQTRNKIEKTELKRAPKSPYVRKIKSSQLLGATSQSQEVTFEFSSQA